MKEKIIKIIDRTAGSVLCYSIYLIDKIKKKEIKELKKILIIMFWGVGSNINSLPAISVLKKHFPGSEITVLAPEKNKDLFYNNKNIDKTIFIDLNLSTLIKTISEIRNKFDLVVDMEHWLSISAILSYFAANRRIGFLNKTRSLLYTDRVKFDKKRHAVLNNLKLLNALGIKEKTDYLEKIKYPSKDKEKVELFLKKNNMGKNDFIIGVCPGSGPTVKERRWPKKRFAELADELVSNYNAKIIFVGSREEKELVKEIQAMMVQSSIDGSGTSLSQLTALIDKCKLFISNDTGPMHIAAAQGIKTIGLFGPETPVIFAPYGKGNISIFKGISCSPCIKIYKGRHIKCKDNKCMKAIKVEDVLMAVEKII